VTYQSILASGFVPVNDGSTAYFMSFEGIAAPDVVNFTKINATLADADAAIDLNDQNITSVGTVDGRDVSADGSNLDTLVAAPTPLFTSYAAVWHGNTFNPGASYVSKHKVFPLQGAVLFDPDSILSYVGAGFGIYDAFVLQAGNYFIDMLTNVYAGKNTQLKLAKMNETIEINGGDNSAKQFMVAGDSTADILVGDVIFITDSTGNDGVYVVSAISYSDPDSTITVVETVTSATMDGTIHYCTDIVINGMRQYNPTGTGVRTVMHHLAGRVVVAAESIFQAWGIVDDSSGQWGYGIDPSPSGSRQGLDYRYIIKISKEA